MSEETKKEIWSWVKTIAFAFVFALAINNFVIVNAQVPTGSMENNIMPKDRLVAFRLSYMFSDPQRFDVVVFEFPDAPKDDKTLFVKRIIGLPGETVTIKDGKVYINNSTTPLDDSFIKEKQNIEDPQTFIVPDDSYFMMGDNRNNSNDSRKWRNSFVDRDKILGKAIFRYFPSPKLFKL